MIFETKDFAINSYEKKIDGFIKYFLYNKQNIYLARSYGLETGRVILEDTIKAKNTGNKKNISDMTLLTQARNMPVIRKPYYIDNIDTDVDINIDKFNLFVGNENNTELTKISLKEYLENISKYTNNDKLKSMYLDRDSKILTSSQSCILPLEENGKAEFNIRFYNYQEKFFKQNVLLFVSTKKGTSTQIIWFDDNQLHFNNNGESNNFFADIQEEYNELEIKDGLPLNDNVIWVYQIPIMCNPNAEPITIEYSKKANDSVSYCGTYNLDLLRDENYPIRCTALFYNPIDDKITLEEFNEKFIKMNKQVNGIYSLGSNKNSPINNNNNNKTSQPKIINITSKKTFTKIKC